MTNPLPDAAGERPEGLPAQAPRNPLQIAWQRKPLVALGVVAGTVVAALLASQRAPVYQSTAQVLVVKRFADAPMAGAADPRATFYEDYVSTHLALIRSQVVIEDAVEKGQLRDLPSFAGQGNPTAAIMVALAATRDTKESGANNIINLSYKGPVPDDCRAVITAVVKSYKDFLDKAYSDVSEDTYKETMRKHDDIVNKLAEKNKDQEELRLHAPLAPSPTKDGAPAPFSRLTGLESRRMDLDMRAGEVEERLKELAAARKTGNAREVVQALSAAAAAAPDRAAADSAAEQQLLGLMMELKAKSNDWGEDHPEIIMLREKIALREMLAPDRRAARLALGQAGAGADPVDAYERQLRQELAGVRLAQRSLDEVTRTARQEAKGLYDFETKDSRLLKEITALEQQRELVVKRLNDILEVRKHGGFDASVISRPGPGVKTGTGLTQLLLAGAAVGLLLGLSLAYLADVTDKSFRSPEEIRRRLGLPIVAHVPVIEEGAGRPGASPLDRSLAIFHRPKSGEAEAARSLRTALYFATKGTTRQVIQVTSPNMGDGKTTVAGNLAIAIAQSGKRVVLVDGDMRRPRVHSLFGVRPEVGLSSVIVGEAPVSAAVVESGIDRLSLVTCGPRPENPAELLTLPRFEEVLAELRQQFDYVIVDTPPLLAVTDPAVVVSRMDGVFLVIRLSKNGRPAAERAREILTTLQANVLGVVVNGVGRAAGAYGYDHYSYDYAYGGGSYAPTPAESNGHAEGQAATATRSRKATRGKKAGGWFGRWRR